MASMFHLFTHAMFKALLFLGAGSIIHAVHSNEMSAMGGLRKYMPITHITFLIACLAIAGIPPFSGFFSKDEILAACFQFSPVMGWIMTVIAAMTAFYMFRLYYGIFWGKDNSKQSSHTPHDSYDYSFNILGSRHLWSRIHSFRTFHQFKRRILHDPSGLDGGWYKHRHRPSIYRSCHLHV